MHRRRHQAGHRQQLYNGSRIGGAVIDAGISPEAVIAGNAAHERPNSATASKASSGAGIFEPQVATKPP